MMMRIALCFPGCYRRGGIERVVLEAANHLQQRGHEVHVFARDVERDLLHQQVHVHLLPDRFDQGIWQLFSFPRACEKSIKASGLKFDATAGFGVACPPTDVGWVTSVHARWLEVSRTYAGGSLKQRLRRRFNPFHHVALALERRRFGPKGHRRLLALTPDVADDLRRFYKVPDARIEVLPNGFDPEAFNPARAALMRQDMRQRFGFGDDDRVLAFVANESVRKGLPVLLRAMAKLDRPELKLLAAGRLPMAEVNAEVKRLGLAGQVHLPGPLDDVTQAYAVADAFVLPTTYEAWGLVIVEALACGLPVVTSRLAGASVAVSHQQTGWLLDDPGSVDEVARSLNFVLNDLQADAAQLSQSVERFRWSVIAEQYEQHFKDMSGSVVSEAECVTP